VVRTGGFEPLNLGSIPRWTFARIQTATFEIFYIMNSDTYEDVRVVKETGLRSVGASLVGSTPTPRIQFGSSAKRTW
jgi:hypothetical protein